MLQQPCEINWPNLYFAASAFRDPFEDVTVVTAKSEFVNLVYKAAADAVYNHDCSLTTKRVSIVAEALIRTEKIYVQECVTVNQAGITVCLDVPSVEGDDVMWKALDFVSKALDQLAGDYGTVFFSDPLKFTLDDVSSFMLPLR